MKAAARTGRPFSSDLIHRACAMRGERGGEAGRNVGGDAHGGLFKLLAIDGQAIRFWRNAFSQRHAHTRAARALLAAPQARRFRSEAGRAALA